MKVYSDSKGRYVIVAHHGNCTLVSDLGVVTQLRNLREAMNFANREAGEVLSWT